MALTNSQYDKIMRDYEQKQLRAEDLLQERLKHIYKSLPEIQEFNTAIANLSVEKARQLILSDDSKALSSLKEELHSLIEKRDQLLKVNGYSKQDLEAQYECTNCKDTGYVSNVKCHCFRSAIIQLLYQQSNLGNILEQENFNTFDISYYSIDVIDRFTGRSSLETMRNALDTCRNFVDTFDREKNNLFLYGDIGVGKTFLTNCIAKELIDQSKSVIYFSAFQMFETMAKGKFDKDKIAQNTNEYIVECDLLIIDDLGTELTNAFTASEFFHCINERLLCEKPTIISTNLSLDALKERYSERTFSRIASNYTMIRLTGEDIRLKKRLRSN